MNTLYISYDGMTDPLGQSQVIPYLIGLSKKGHSISIVSCEKSERFKKSADFIKQLLEANSISWHPVPYSELPSIFSKQLNLIRIQGVSKNICSENKIELIHCRSYMAALIGLKLKNKLGIKFIFDMRGFWADERIDGNIWNIKNPIQKSLYSFFKKKELEFLNTADYTISLTENAKKEILSWKPFLTKEIPIEVIPCCADLNLFTQKNIDLKKQEELRSDLKLNKDNFVISYLGSIGTWYLLDEMLDFFQCLLEKKVNAKFLFITPDDKNTIISKAVAKGISKDQLIIHSASRNEVPLYLSLSVISIYFIKPLYSKKASSPTKTGEILSLGIPIITNTGIGDSDKIITDSGAGMLINEFTIEEYNRIISQIDVFLNIDNRTITDASKKYFSLEKGIEIYDRIYAKLSSEKN
jgi:glycosyltransferase involved in cell wall biosynthesis